MKRKMEFKLTQPMPFREHGHIQQRCLYQQESMVLYSLKKEK